MLTTGCDLIEISRIKRSLQHPAFFKRIFGEIEQKELSSKKGTSLFQSAAGCFAAKEAFSKALGIGFRYISLKDIQLVHDSLGKPYFLLSGKAEDIAHRQGLSFSVSITHTKEYAAAFVVAFQEE